MKMRNSNLKMLTFFKILFALLILLNSCNSRQENKSVNLGYAQKLTEADYTIVMSQHFLDSIWASQKNRTALKNIIFDTGVSEEAKFIAAEILFNKDHSFPSEAERSILADVYQKILQTDKYQFYFIMHKNENSMHREREHLLSLEKEIIPYLYLLLDNNNPYSDSMLFRGNTPHAVKNIACSYICEMLNFSYKHSADSVQNNLFIDSLKKKMPDNLKVISKK
jgi:hypothetical protein